MNTAPRASTSHASAPAGRISLQTLRDMKQRRVPIAMLTAYDYPTAKILADTGIHILLVGDSAATTILGADSTIKATYEFLLTITEAVHRGAPNAFLMADMPFASYPDVRTAVANAARFVREGGADSVKLEADIRHAEIVTAMSAAGITVCAHVGLLPQRASQQGGYLAQGRTPAEARRIVDDALALAAAGAHLLLIEAVPDEVTAEIIGQVQCPVLGCGAGPSADGHVVVLHDMLGYSERPPRFVEKFADVPAVISAAAVAYAKAIRNREYPAARHQYHSKPSS